METNQENILIAKFMGIELFGKDKNYTEALLICSALNLFVNPLIHFKHISEIINVDNFKFDSSWDWLMPVVEKIAKDYDVRITWMPTAIDVTYIDRPDVSEGEITSMGGMTAIENTFIAVVRFIKWYNLNKKS